MNLTLVAAQSRNRVIGVGGRIPWHLPADLRRFRALTMGKPMLMGRTTYESIGRPLPGRRSLVLTRGATLPGVECFGSVDAALAVVLHVPEVMVVGGGIVYEALLPRASKICLTTVDVDIDGGDAFFPELARAEWVITEHREFSPTPEDPLPSVYAEFVRR